MPKLSEKALKSLLFCHGLNEDGFKIIDQALFQRREDLKKEFKKMVEGMKLPELSNDTSTTDLKEAARLGLRVGRNQALDDILKKLEDL